MINNKIYEQLQTKYPKYKINPAHKNIKPLETPGLDSTKPATIIYQTPNEKLAQDIKKLLETPTFGGFFSQFKNILNDYVQPTILDPNIERWKPSGTRYENSNEDRIIKHKILNHLFNTLQYRYILSEDYFNKISFKKSEDAKEENDTIIKFWRSMTNKVCKKKVLGFPLCIYIGESVHYTPLIVKEPAYNLYFLKYQVPYTTTLFTRIMDNNNSLKKIIFQKTLILYNLYLNNMSADHYQYEELYDAKGLKIAMKIKDLVFNVDLQKIIFLSPNTRLITQRLSVMDYLNSFDDEEKKELKELNTDNFLDFLYINFSEWFDKSIYNTRSINIIMEQSVETTHLTVGTLYILKKKTYTPVYVLILNISEHHIKYLILFDSTIKNILSLKRTVIQRKDPNYVFYYPNLDFEENLFLNAYCMGDFV